LEIERGKMKKKIIIIVIVAIALILFLVANIGIKIATTAMNTIDDDDLASLEDDYDDYYEEENVITGSGNITSFNVEKLDIGLWSKVDKVLVTNETMVEANQEILNVSNSEATGKVYSTISGEFISEDDNYIIYDLNNLGYEINVDENEAAKLKIGQKVETIITASNEKIYGRICYISYIPQNEEITVKVKIENSDKIKIGYSVNAYILLDEAIDESVQVYDIKNSIPKIGKTTVTYKDNGSQESFSSIEELFSQEDLMAMYEEMMKSQMENMEIPEEGYDEEEQEEFDLDAISDYYSDIWSEYWNEYWKSYYEEYQSFLVIEPES
jgi:hypothetical protein